jgi:hypothetical protein
MWPRAPEEEGIVLMTDTELRNEIKRLNEVNSELREELIRLRDVVAEPDTASIDAVLAENPTGEKGSLFDT